MELFFTFSAFFAKNWILFWLFHEKWKVQRNPKHTWEWDREIIVSQPTPFVTSIAHNTILDVDTLYRVKLQNFSWLKFQATKIEMRYCILLTTHAASSKTKIISILYSACSLREDKVRENQLSSKNTCTRWLI